MKTVKRRYANLDALKIFAVMLTILAAAPFKGVIGDYIAAICQIGYPLLMMVAGYIYFMKEIKDEREGILRLVIIMAVSNFAYLFLQTIIHALNGDAEAFRTSYLTFETLKNFFLFNYSPFAATLWFIGAALYVIYIARQVRMSYPNSFIRILSIITPLLLVSDLMFGKYSIVIFGKSFDTYKLQNYLFVGIPNFAIGYLIAGNRIKMNIKENTLTFVTAGIALLNIVERYLLVRFSVNGPREVYICTTLLAIAIFILFIKTPEANPTVQRLAKLGRYYAPMMFVIFPAFAIIFAEIFKTIDIYFYIQPIVVIVVTYWVTYFIVNKFLKPKKMR